MCAVFLKAGYHDKTSSFLQNKASAGDVASDMQKTANDQRKLQQMINYCETDKCLREFILSYFGDTTPCICNKCSNCVVVEDEEEETYVETGKKRKKAAQLAGLNELGVALFVKAAQRAYRAGCRKVGASVYHLLRQDLKDMCASCRGIRNSLPMCTEWVSRRYKIMVKRL